MPSRIYWIQNFEMIINSYLTFIYLFLFKTFRTEQNFSTAHPIFFKKNHQKIHSRFQFFQNVKKAPLNQIEYKFI